MSQQTQTLQPSEQAFQTYFLPPTPKPKTRNNKQAKHIQTMKQILILIGYRRLQHPLPLQSMV